MADELRHDKKIEIVLKRPYVTNGRAIGVETQTGPDGKLQRVFTGKATVSPEEAEDLANREQTYDQYEADLHRDKGSRINAGTIMGSGDA